jgi:hypothetical protein
LLTECLGWPGTVILPISTSCVAGITGVNSESSLNRNIIYLSYYKTLSPYFMTDTSMNAFWDTEGQVKIGLVECLPIKNEALSSNPSISKKKKKGYIKVQKYITLLVPKEPIFLL